MNRKKYLDTIGIDKTEILPNLQNLKFLQRQHLLHIPFENLDIYWKRPIILDTEKLYRKIVEENRGGFCYELNGLFNELLKEIGFQTKIISARVAKAEGKFSDEYSHLTILAQVEGEEYLVDVGFGSFIAEPLKFILDVEQTDECGIFMIRTFDDDYFEVVKKDNDEWQSENIFKNLSHDLAEFTERCHFQQTSPESKFTRNKICSLMTSAGRKTLTDNKFIETKNGEKNEKNVDSEEEFNQILAREFNIRRNF